MPPYVQRRAVVYVRVRSAAAAAAHVMLRAVNRGGQGSVVGVCGKVQTDPTFMKVRQVAGERGVCAAEEMARGAHARAREGR